MRVFEKIRGLVIWDWYFSGRMETISTKKKGKERKQISANNSLLLEKTLYSVYLGTNIEPNWGL